MIFECCDVFAEEDAFPPGRVPASTGNPMEAHAAADGKRQSVQAAINMPGSANAENRVKDDDCGLCQTEIEINQKTDGNANTIIGPDGKPIKSSR